MTDHADTQYPAHAPIDYPEILKRVRKERARTFHELFAGGARATATLIMTRVVEPYRQYRDRREGMRALEQLSDHHLKDIGLTRGDIRAAVAGEFLPARARRGDLDADPAQAAVPRPSVCRHSREMRRAPRSLHRQRAAEVRRRRQHVRNAERALRGAVTEIRRHKAEAKTAR
ncbi:MAG: DUF1127 domain-containing protein [Methyloligellaceae bacterium]